MFLADHERIHFDGEGRLVISDPLSRHAIIIPKWDELKLGYLDVNYFSSDGESVGKTMIFHRVDEEWYIAEVSDNIGISARKSSESEIESFKPICWIENA